MGALLVRDEAAPDRYLQRVLANAASFCDALVVLDDGSTDDTARLCREAGATVTTRESRDGWWGEGRESSARHELWTRACAAAQGGWVYVADGDQELVGIAPADFRRLLTAQHVTAWACPLWDCWDSDQQHRVDGYWQAWRSPRAWLARAIPVSSWNTRGIHSGHLPDLAWRVGLMPPGAAIRHLGYVKEAQRVAKRAKYLTLGERKQGLVQRVTAHA